MLKKLFLGTVVVTFVAAFGAVAVQAGSKVQVCHIPPGNPDNFHTITVNENALQAHLGHGDLPGSCSANADALCNDGNACTIDAMNAETETCLADHPPVDCNDSNLCTQDSCDPTNGCQSAPIACDDANACTVDACNPSNGQCTASPINCGPLGYCLLETGACDFPCDGITCDPIDQCHAPGECVLSGTAGACEDGGALPDGTACDDGNTGTDGDVCTGGACAGTPSGPCSQGLEDGGFEVGLTSGPGTAAISTSYGCWNAVQGPNGYCGTNKTILLGMPWFDTGNSTTIPVYEGAETMLIGNCNEAFGGISQTFATTIGAQYELSFAAVGWDQCSVTTQVTLSNPTNTDLMVDIVTPGACTSGATLSWIVHSVNFTATGALTTLEFLNKTSNGRGAILDDVRMTSVP